jgi:hypothetical protein
MKIKRNTQTNNKNKYIHVILPNVVDDFFFVVLFLLFFVAFTNLNTDELIETQASITL